MIRTVGTVVDITPRANKSQPGKIPLYRRDGMKSTKAPVKKAKRFVADCIPPIQ